MATKTTNRVKRFFIVLNFLVVIPYLLACLSPYLHAGIFWFIALTGLAFPILLAFVLLFLIIWVIARSRWSFFLLAVLLLSWQQISVVYSFRIGKKFTISKREETLRVLSWNVSRWDERNKEKRGGTSYRGKMMELVQKQNADILCLQEFFECRNQKYFEENIPVFQKMGYTHHYFFPSFSLFDSTFLYGLIIFSRYPIIDSAHFINNAGKHSEGFCYADIKINNQVIRVFTADVESAGFNKEDYKGLRKIENPGAIIGKLKTGYRLRSNQAENLQRHLEASPYPVIVCADLDDVPGSYAYSTVKADLQDAFLKKSAGLGRTLRTISPTLRVDYIFAGREFKVNQFTRLQVVYSDHYPLIADLEFTK